MIREFLIALFEFVLIIAFFAACLALTWIGYGLTGVGGVL